MGLLQQCHKLNKHLHRHSLKIESTRGTANILQGRPPLTRNWRGTRVQTHAALLYLTLNLCCGQTNKQTNSRTQKSYPQSISSRPTLLAWVMSVQHKYMTKTILNTTCHIYCKSIWTTGRFTNNITGSSQNSRPPVYVANYSQ